MFSVEFIRWISKDAPTVVLRLEETFESSIAALRRADALMNFAQALTRAEVFRVRKDGEIFISISQPVT